jgi:hypothetical protein
MKDGFVIHHDNADHPVYPDDTSHRRCERFWQGVYDWHTGANPSSPHNWSDIAYSFGICRHGIRFEGLGWNRDQFAGGTDQVTDNLMYRDRYWYSVLCFLGGDEEPTAEMLHGVLLLLRDGRESGRCGNRVIPHNLVRNKPCPGPTLTAWAYGYDNQPLTDPPLPQPAKKGKHMIWTTVEPGGTKTSYYAADGIVLSLHRMSDAARWNIGTTSPNWGDVSVEEHYVLLHGYCGGHARELAPGVWGR